MSERQYEFEELQITSLPGVFCYGRVWIEMDRDGWRIDRVEMSDGAIFVELDERNPLHSALVAAIKLQLEADSKFVDIVDSDYLEEYPMTSDYDEHSTYRVFNGRVVG